MANGQIYITAKHKNKDGLKVPVSKKQLIRLIRLVAQLKENRYPNCAGFANDMRKADLNENLNVACTARTILRDIQTLKNDFEAPIQFSHVHNGYFLTDHNWNFSCPQVFDDSEILSAVLGARLAEHIFPAPMKQRIRDAVDFLLTSNNPSFLEKGQIDSLVLIPSNKTQINASVFMPLFQAWQNHEVCNISYQDSRGQNTERFFEPHALIYYDGFWYAKGFCHLRKEMRTLMLSRIRSVVVTGEKFCPDVKIIKTANEYGLFDAEMLHDVVIKCDDYLTKIISSRVLHPEQKVVELTDGCSEIHVESIPRPRLITWIMHQCGRATIVRPAQIANEIIGFANDIITNHIQGDFEK